MDLGQCCWHRCNQHPYDFRLTFDLTGLDPSTAHITGSWGVDNYGQIELNGSTVGIGSGALNLPNINGGQGNFNVFHSFALTNGFVAGINSIDILATDQGNPGAINVTNLVGTAQPLSSVPEPSTLLTSGICASLFLAIGACRRFRSASSTQVG